MNDHRFPQDRDLSSLVDRLAADELDDDSRGALFAWLDREPTRWRRCALALLEAREWEGALDDWLGESASHAARPTGPLGERQCDRGPRVSHREQKPGRYAIWAIAASVALAFGLGMAADRRFVAWREGEAPRAVAHVPRAPASGDAHNQLPHADAADAAQIRQRQTAGGGEKSGDAGALVQQGEPVASPHSQATDKQLIPAYVKSQLERRGYRVDSRRQFLSVTLPDGRRVSAPVGMLKFSYVGNRAY